MDHAFAVPLVTAHVSRKETYSQIVTALTELDKASASVLDGIIERVEAQRALVGAIDARVVKANKWIAEIAERARGGEAWVSLTSTTGDATDQPTRTSIIVTAPSRFPSKSDEFSQFLNSALPVLHHEKKSIHSTPSADKPRVTPRRTQDEHDAAEVELFQRQEGQDDVLELFRRLRGVRSGRVENDEEDEDLDDDGDYDGPTKDDSAVLPSENSDTIDIENGKARQEKAALQELIASLETRRAAGVTT